LTAIRTPGYRFPVWLRARTSDRQAFDEIIVGDELGFDVDQAPETIMDLGANIGLSSVYLANRFPAARILAVEVDPGNVDVLRRNTRPYPAITVVPKAVWHRDCYVRVENPTDEPWAFRVVESRPDEPGAIEAVSVPTLLNEHAWPRVDFIKMDIEGAERDLFALNRCDWMSRVSIMAVELHDRFREGCSSALASAIADLPHRAKDREHYRIVELVKP
jgi:FkbM family methyltransferase